VSWPVQRKNTGESNPHSVDRRLRPPSTPIAPVARSPACPPGKARGGLSLMSSHGPNGPVRGCMRKLPRLRRPTRSVHPAWHIVQAQAPPRDQALLARHPPNSAFPSAPRAPPRPPPHTPSPPLSPRATKTRPALAVNCASLLYFLHLQATYI